MNEQEIRTLIPELIWEKVDRHGYEEYQALDYQLGLERMYYRISHPAQVQDGVYYVSRASKRDVFKGAQFWRIATAYSLEDAKQLAQEHRAKAICQMLRIEPSSEQPAKPTEDAQPINVRELLDEERDRLADECNRGEWDTLPNEMKYLKRKQYDTLLSYLTLLDQLAECEAKNAGI
nr:MAG TPA: hypothetical protein [Caudoviricetes sp.]